MIAMREAGMTRQAIADVLDLEKQQKRAVRSKESGTGEIFRPGKSLSAVRCVKKVYAIPRPRSDRGNPHFGNSCQSPF